MIINEPQVLDISIRRSHVLSELCPADTEGCPDGGEDDGGEDRELDVPLGLEDLSTGVVGGAQLELSGEGIVSQHPLETHPDTFCKFHFVLEAGGQSDWCYQAVRGVDDPE